MPTKPAHAPKSDVAAKPSLTLKRRLNAPPPKVFQAWTEPKAMMQWFAPSHCVTERAESEPRVGGRFRVVMRENNGEVHDVSGIYREVVLHEKLVFTWAWRTTRERESLVTVLIRPDGDGTLLTLTHEQFFDEKARDDHRSGWTGALDKLAQYLA